MEQRLYFWIYPAPAERLDRHEQGAPAVQRWKREEIEQSERQGHAAEDPQERVEVGHRRVRDLPEERGGARRLPVSFAHQHPSQPARPFQEQATGVDERSTRGREGGMAAEDVLLPQPEPPHSGSIRPGP